MSSFMECIFEQGDMEYQIVISGSKCFLCICIQYRDAKTWSAV